jgi:hypothetical protein
MYLTMASQFEHALKAAADSIPVLAEYIATIPNAKREVALVAAERHYLEVARSLGSTEEPALRWARALMSDLNEKIEQIADRGPIAAMPSRSGDDFNFAEKLLTRVTGALALLVVSPVIALVWIGLKAERGDPAISLRTTNHVSVKTYSFVLGSGWVSCIVRYAELQSIPSLWNLLNGDIVLKLKDLAQVVQIAPSRK